MIFGVTSCDSGLNGVHAKVTIDQVSAPFVSLSNSSWSTTPNFLWALDKSMNSNANNKHINGWSNKFDCRLKKEKVHIGHMPYAHLV